MFVGRHGRPWRIVPILDSVSPRTRLCPKQFLLDLFFFPSSSGLRVTACYILQYNEISSGHLPSTVGGRSCAPSRRSTRHRPLLMRLYMTKGPRMCWCMYIYRDVRPLRSFQTLQAAFSHFISCRRRSIPSSCRLRMSLPSWLRPRPSLQTRRTPCTSARLVRTPPRVLLLSRTSPLLLLAMGRS